MENYINLINFSHYSVSGGLLTIDEIIDNAKKKNQTYASLTDLNTLSGIPEFYEKCIKNNIKPIIGTTLSVTDNNEYIGDITLIAKNQKGFDNIKRLVSKLGEFKNSKFRSIDLKEILNNSDDILFLEGAKNSIAYNITNKEQYNEIFSRINNSFGLNLIGTIQPNNDKKVGIDAAQRLMGAINNSAVKNEENGKIKKNRVIFSNNNRFQDKELYFLQMNKFHEYSHLKKSLEKSKEKVPDKFIDKNDYYLNEEDLEKSLSAFSSKLQGKGILLKENSIVPKIGEYKIFKDPEFPKLSEEQTLNSIIKDKWANFKTKIPNEKRKEYIDRLKLEIETINEMGFGDYFVIVNEIANSAKESGQTTAIRGSGAASLIVHVLGLSDIDPIQHDLMFGRFLNKGRNEYPDLDIETSDNLEMLQLLRDRYGAENSANLVSYDTLSKSSSTYDFVINSLKRYATQDLEFQQKLNIADNTISKSLSFFKRSKKQLSEILETNPYIQKIYNGDKFCKKIIDLSIRMENQIRNRKVSIGTAILSNKSIQKTLSTVETQTGVNSYIEVDKNYIQKMGHLKMDILSSVILKKLNLAAKNSNVDLASIATSNLDDPKVFHFLSKGLLSHINQISSRFKLESEVTDDNPQGIGATMCKEIQPKNFQELAAIMALIRMGEEDASGNKPEQYQKYLDGKNNPESIVYKHPDLESVLSETYGAIIFEEQIMKISQKIANFTDSEADNLRSVIKKEKVEAIPEIKDKFINNAINNNISKEVATDIFKDIEDKMGTYQFNKAHACVYAAIAYQQMYLKVYHPAEFYDAHFNKDQTHIYKHELMELGTFVKRPDINSSNMSPETIYVNSQGKEKLVIDFSLNNIINNNVLENILEERKEYGYFTNIFEYCERIIPIYTDCNLMSEEIKTKKSQNQIDTFKNDTIKLIKVGAFDDLKLTEENNILYNRSLLIENIDTIINSSINSHIEMEITINNPNNILSNEEVQDFENNVLPISPLEHYNKILATNSKKKQSRKIS